MISQDQVKGLFNYNQNTGVLTWKVATSRCIKVGDRAGSVEGDGRVRINIKYNRYRAHRIIFLMFKGYLPEFIDHIDGDNTNNKIENLRECTKSENSWNAKLAKTNKSGVKGVYQHKTSRSWIAYISHKGRQMQIGSFKTIDEASKAVRDKRNELHGEFANHGKLAAEGF